MLKCNNDMAIQYKNVYLTESEEVIKKFPIIRGKDLTNIILYANDNEIGLPTFVVMGITKLEANPDNNMQLIEWLKKVAFLMAYDVSSLNEDAISKRNNSLEVFRSNRITQKILFSQEAFDLIMGKQYTNHENQVVRTVDLPYEIENQKVQFTNKWRMVPGIRPFFEDSPFLPFNKYYDNYLINPDEMDNPSLDAAYKTAIINKTRLLKWLEPTNHAAALTFKSSIGIDTLSAKSNVIGCLDAAMDYKAKSTGRVLPKSSPKKSPTY